MSLPARCIPVVLMVVSLLTADCFADQSVDASLTQIGGTRGVVALLLGPDSDADHAIGLAKASELTIYVQSADDGQAAALREAADAAGLLGSRIFVDSGSLDSIHLADNLADCILVSASAKERSSDTELLRVLSPRATAFVGDRKLVKPVPVGIDEWSHPYHGPDNNPQSNDQLVRGAFQTQFLGYPKFSPMPEQSVIAGGRIYKAMGHIAHKANQNEMLNTLLCINAHNGTILWRRPSPPGFMIHRNTMIATEDALYLGDHESCKIIDGRTGETREQITVPKEITDGPVWKWMAMKDGILYALVGNPEMQVGTQTSDRRGLGHWPWGMWEGHDYKDPRTAFGYGRTLVAIDLQSKDKKVLWHYRDDEFLDARAVCMSGDRIFCYSPERFLLCVDAHDGKLLWRNSDKDLLNAIDANSKAQHYVTGYATTAYMKCNDQFVLFAGPQRNKLVAASAADGKLAWTFPTGNLQLVLRDDAIWAAGPQQTESGFRLDYATGKILATFPSRRACTRATGCADSIFFRASGGTIRVLTETNTAQHIDPMRPPCQDGVLIAGGHLYWGPWMCGCELSLYGNICLSPTGDAVVDSANLYQDALVAGDNLGQVAPLDMHDDDWPSYRGGNARDDITAVSIPESVELKWNTQVSSGELPTAPVVAGGLVFVADRSGAVRALDKDGSLVWKTFTAGPVYYPPAVANDRVYVGSADGRVYALEARTGRFLWSYRVAPQERWIPVYGKLISAWPVAGGVVVADGTVYAAAGITHYDGTYVVALDAVTGKLKSHNSTSGTLEAEVNNGISLQGELTIVGNELQFLAGGVYETARYDLQTLECLNTPRKQVNSQFRTAFYPYYPEYGKYVSLDYTCTDGCLLTHDASYEGSKFTNLSLEEALPPGTENPRQEAARWLLRRGGKPPAAVWKDSADRRFTSFIISPTQLLTTGHPDAEPERAFLAAVNIKDGTDAWSQEIPAQAVKGGTAIDHERNIYVALENGQLLCFAPSGK
ncbi:MAG: PQQ-binding-like beta-propeller repeat protein [Planctomycetota bacterium]|nr:PQQ-binding-like beta-propeller repeat protein [Planctomycetota bacterium]